MTVPSMSALIQNTLVSNDQSFPQLLPGTCRSDSVSGSTDMALAGTPADAAADNTNRRLADPQISFR